MLLFLLLCFASTWFKVSGKNLTKEELFDRIDKDVNLAHEVIKYVYKKYPYFLPRLYGFDKTKFEGVVNSSTYEGYVLEIKRKETYQLVVNEFRTNVEGDKKKGDKGRDLKQTSLFTCSRAIRYSSGNPRFIEYREGSRDSNIIIISSHDGHLRPENIPDRDAGCFIDGKCVYDHKCVKKGYKKNFSKCMAKDFNDNFSTDIAEALEKQLTWYTKKRPHIVINRLHRTKLDANREIDIAAFGNSIAEQAWRDFHDLIRQAKRNLNGRRGIIFDIHGNSVRDGLIMLGYGLHPSEMDKEAITMNMTTIENLGRFAKVPFEQLVRGELSLGHYLWERGYHVIPSPKIKRPRGRHYYRGSYTIREHGSNTQVHGGQVDAIQIEVHSRHRNDEDFERFSKDLALSIKKFVDNNYFHQIETVVSANKTVADKLKQQNENNNNDEEENSEKENSEESGENEGSGESGNDENNENQGSLAEEFQGDSYVAFDVHFIKT